MWSMQDMFYGEQEPVWIVKPEKKDDNKKGGGESSTPLAPAKQPEYSILNLIPDYPYYYPSYVAPATPKPEAKKDTQVVMKVPLCCGECEETVLAAFYGMKGVKSVVCDTRREKVTVVATTAAPADILLTVRSLTRDFRSSRMWTSDD